MDSASLLMVDYSSWKTIELSSDEDDVHPFIDNGTLFRLRHEARLKKMEERKQEEFTYECHKASYTERLEKLQHAMDERKKENQDLSDLQQQMKELKFEEQQLQEKENKLNKQMVSWYIDTICHPGFSKMFVNDCSSNDDSPQQFHNFIRQNKSALKRFGLLKNFEETKNFFILNPHIIKKQTLYFLVSYGIKMYLKEEKEKLRNISRQIVCLQHILELFKIYNNNSEDILRSFFTSIKQADQNCKFDFEKETLKVQKLIKNLVKSQINEMENNEKMEETNSNEETSYILDPVEVLESLPEDIQYCFMTKDKKRLANILGMMSKEEAEYHMKRCIDSGLWIPQT